MKSAYAKFIEWDEKMFDQETNTPAYAAKWENLYYYYYYYTTTTTTTIVLFVLSSILARFLFIFLEEQALKLWKNIVIVIIYCFGIKLEGHIA